jgi:general secretion pathway protein L
MKILPAINEWFSRWIDCVAGAFVNVLGHISSRRTVRIIEQLDGDLVISGAEQIPNGADRIRIAEGHIVEAVPAGITSILSGSRVELLLRPDRFLFRPLELPGQATEFLEGIVRAQIDRLTPWNANEAAFGWTKPTRVGNDRITITVAATAFGLITPFVQATADSGAHSVAVFTSFPEPKPSSDHIKIMQEQGKGVLDTARVRHALVLILGAAVITAGLAIAAWIIIGPVLDAQQDDLTRQIASVRSTAASSREAASGSLTAQHKLEQRKRDAAASVLVLETLSQILPDHTYLTELRIENNKARLVGVTLDAPSLIGLIEQSGRFTRATFFAPTTRSPSEQTERFHIEAHIQPEGP